jgi:hypothetical protein
VGRLPASPLASAFVSSRTGAARESTCEPQAPRRVATAKRTSRSFFGLSPGTAAGPKLLRFDSCHVYNASTMLNVHVYRRSR